MLFRILTLVLASLALNGCASSRPLSPQPSRPFDFARDTFAYPNELVWEYHFDEKGKRTVQRREPAPGYSHHCFVVVRSAQQFFQCACFDPAQPVRNEATYRGLVRQVASCSSRGHVPGRTCVNKVVIPGYGNLREFSFAQEHLLKAESGGGWRSYFQRGHWRMVLPFTRGHQQRIADQLTNALAEDRPPVVHLVRFPSLAINHAVLVFQARATDEKIAFSVYDPNDSNEPAILTYDRKRRTFYYKRNAYFLGGPVDVYEIFHAWNY